MPDQSPDALASPSAPARPPRALLVDDEPVIRKALRRFLARQGWEVDEAEDGAQALGRLLGAGDAPAEHYDVVITDLRMPGVSGIALHDRLASERPDLLPRLVLSTGDSVSPEASRFLDGCSCPVLHKPFELDELRAVLARVRGTP